MSPSVRVKPGVEFTTIAPAGLHILAAIEYAADACNLDLTITSACDGLHSGPDDPHHFGCAYDVRCHDMTPDQKLDVLYEIMSQLATTPFADSQATAITTERFFGWIEDAGGPNEHLHIQLRHGVAYP